MTDPRPSLRERGFLTPDHRLTEAGIAECERIKAELRGAVGRINSKEGRVR
jgi:hypothetical protein